MIKLDHDMTWVSSSDSSCGQHRQLIVSRFGFHGANSTHHGSQLCLPKHAQATANTSQTFVGKHVIVVGS